MEKRASITEQVFGEALDLPLEERAAFLDEVCRGAPEVRRAVEALLEENDRLRGFLSASPIQEGEAREAESLAAGARLGRYSILEPLGAGGMGVVYRARDEKLDRVIAIKLLAPGVLSGEVARRQFHREARALAKLNHPRIAAVYDVGEQDGVDYIVMELVEGESLGAKLRAGPLPVKEATAIAIEVAEALEEAHEHGVIHRDLKPANVMITPKGQAKVLDFGLARLVGPKDGTQTAAESPAMGTPLYMAPEQAIGQKADVRSDLWSLGVTYYESLAGAAPFQGGSSLAILRAITDEAVPALREARADVPVLAEQIVERALQKDPELRYQRARDFATDLRRVMRDLEPASGRRPRNETAGTGAGGEQRRIELVLRGSIMGGVLVVMAAAILLTPARVTGPLDSTQITFSGDDKQGPLLTDGARLYFQSRNIPSEMATSGGMIAPILGLSSGMYLADALADGSKVLVWTADLNDETGRGWLLVGSSLGGSWRKISSHMAHGIARWSPDGSRSTLWTITRYG